MVSNIFCDLDGDDFLYQFVSGVTPIADGKQDLLLCNRPKIIGDVFTSALGQCSFPNDHYIIELTGRVKFEGAIRLLGVRFTISSAVILNIFTDSFPVCLSTLLSCSTSYCIVL